MILEKKFHKKISNLETTYCLIDLVLLDFNICFIFFIVFFQNITPKHFAKIPSQLKNFIFFFPKHFTEFWISLNISGLGFKWNGFRNEILNYVLDPILSVMHVGHRTGCVEPQSWQQQQPYREYPYRWYQHAWLLKSYVLAIFDIRVGINHQRSASVQVRLH